MQPGFFWDIITAVIGITNNGKIDWEDRWPKWKFGIDTTNKLIQLVYVG